MKLHKSAARGDRDREQRPRRTDIKNRSRMAPNCESLVMRIVAAAGLTDRPRSRVENHPAAMHVSHHATERAHALGPPLLAPREAATPAASVAWSPAPGRRSGWARPNGGEALTAGAGASGFGERGMVAARWRHFLTM